MLTHPKYKPNWHHEIIADHLEGVYNGDIKRLMIFMPPRYGKTELTSIRFPAWVLGHRPTTKIINAGYSSDLTVKFGRQTRNILKDSNYGLIFKTKLAGDSTSAGYWETSEGGSYLSAGVGGAITGHGADIFIVDDPLKNREEADSKVIRDKVWDWYTSTAYTRLEQNAAIIIVNTRWHDDDLAGRLLKQNPEEWTVIDFPAIAERDEKFREKGEPLWPAKYSLEDLEHTKRSIGIYDWSSLYQQKPVNREAQEFKDHYFHHTQELPQGLRCTMTVDLASSEKEKSDENAISVVGVARDKRKYILEDWGDHGDEGRRCNPGEVIDKILELASKWDVDEIGIESVAYQKTAAYWLKEKMRGQAKYYLIRELKTSTRKEQKIRGLLPLYSNTNIFHYHPSSKLIEQAKIFPNGAHDDRIDALSMQLDMMEEPSRVQTSPINAGGGKYGIGSYSLSG